MKEPSDNYYKCVSNRDKIDFSIVTIKYQVVRTIVNIIPRIILLTVDEKSHLFGIELSSNHISDEIL
jgi:hypothetical protein